MEVATYGGRSENHSSVYVSHVVGLCLCGCYGPVGDVEGGSGCGDDGACVDGYCQYTWLVETHWEKDEPNPVTEAGQFLHDLAHYLYDKYIFNNILTPDYNAAHYNHLHVDLEEGAHFLK